MLDWRKIPKIDAHVHLIPEDVRKANMSYGNKFIDYGSVREYIKLMDTYNIIRSFIMPFNDPYMFSIDHCIESVHNNMYKMTKNNKDKLYCFADIDIRRSIEDTLKEFDRVLCNDRFLGIKLHPTNTGYPIDGLYYDKIFSYASKQNILLEIHSYPRDTLVDDICSPTRIKKVLDKYPDLRISIAHMGGYQYKELLDYNVYFNISAILNDFVDKLGLKKTNKILRKIGISRLIFATDYPDNRSLKSKEIYDTYFEILNRMDFSYEEAKQICMNNVLRMVNYNKK